jgi:hypothetical protein
MAEGGSHSAGSSTDDEGKTPGEEGIGGDSTAEAGASSGSTISGCKDEPCLNGGTCSDGATPPSYTCACAPGFAGNNCQTDVDDCNPNPCNGGMCTDEVAGFICSNCPAGYTGTSCSTDIDECLQNPCLHSGKCANKPGTFSCDCSNTGYIGTTCQYAECVQGTSPCQNAGMCFDIEGSLTCDCSGTGYSGTTCQNDIDECATTPCQNGGTCTQGAPGTYACSCGTRFVGKNCEFQKFRGTGIPAGMDSFSADYVSGDGSVVAGTATAASNVHQSFRLTGNTFTPVAIPNGFSSCVTCGITQDGQLLAGSCSADLATVIRTFTQVAGGAPTFLPSASAIADAECGAMNSHGSVFLDGGHLIWTSYSGWKDVTGNAPGMNVKAVALSDDFSVVVGWNVDTGRAWRRTPATGYELADSTGWHWINPGQSLGGVTGSSDSRALGVNANGTVIIGTATIGGVTHAVRWSGPSDAAKDLGMGSAADVSADGSVVVGESGGVAAVWSSQGLSTLDSLLGDTSDLAGWSLGAATAVSDDGKVIVGRGVHNGAGESFVVHLP